MNAIPDRQAEINTLHAMLFPPQPARTAPEGPHAAVSPDDNALIERASNARNGAKFLALWRGELAGYASHSEADLALASMLAYWCGDDPGRVDSLFRQSGLYRAEKWDRRTRVDGATYGQLTVQRACRGA